MSTFVNLLDVVYPTGSIYCSTSTTSPATTFGGTWTQVKDAFLAAKGSDYITGSLANYSGDKHMKHRQMPVHTHDVEISGVNASTIPYYISTVNKTGYSWSKDVAWGDTNYFNFIKNYEKDTPLTDDEYDKSRFSNLGVTSGIGWVGGGKISLLTIIQSIFGAEPHSLKRRWA